MNYREIGSTGVKVSEIGFGCWTMGGLNWSNGNPVGWAEVNEEDITAAIKVGLDAGVTHFDNADIYGNGRAERMLARVLKRLGIKSESLVIATKVGHFHGTAEHAYEPMHIRHQCEQSLQNLQREYIDIYYFHHGDFGPDAKYLEPAAETMNALVKEGKVRIKGQSAYSTGDFLRAIPVVQPQVLQSWGHAMDAQFFTPESEVGKAMEAHDISFVAFSPLRQGLLLDKFDPENPPHFEEGDHRSRNKAFTREELLALKPKLEILKQRFGASIEALASMAMNYVLSYPRVASVIPGFRNARQAACNVQAAGQTLSTEDLRFIEQTLGTRRK